MATTVSIGPVDQIPPGEGRNFIVEQEEIAVFRTYSDEVFATQAYCPHRKGPLADGLLGSKTIVCPLHDRTFDLRTGEEVGAECARLRTYQISLTASREMTITL